METAINTAVSNIDFSKHKRIPAGSHNDGDPLPEGLIYEDVVGVLMRIFRYNYLTSIGKDQDAQDVPGIEQTDITEARQRMQAVMGTIQRFISADPKF